MFCESFQQLLHQKAVDTAYVPTVVYPKVFDGNHVLTGKEERYPKKCDNTQKQNFQWFTNINEPVSVSDYTALTQQK
jgi:hypothetical protein